MKLTRISTENYNGQSICKKCRGRSWSCMMVEFKEIDGHYCHKCAKEIEKEYLNKVQVVIEVDEDTIKSAKRNGLILAPRYRDDLTQAIRNCIVLQKGHGDLKDMSNLRYVFDLTRDDPIYSGKDIEIATKSMKTIIEEDGGAE